MNKIKNKQFFVFQAPKLKDCMWLGGTLTAFSQIRGLCIYVQAPVHGPGGLGWFTCVLKSTPLGLAAPPGALGATTSPAKWSCSSVFCEAGGCLIVSRHRVAPFYARLTTPITIPDRPAVQDRDQRAPWRATKVRANRASSKFVCRYRHRRSSVFARPSAVAFRWSAVVAVREV